jgi:RNA polymerase sigma-70 factor (sigma-E family)
MDERDAFASFVASSSRQLLRSAWLLTGDWEFAEDLVQSALAATWSRWTRLQRVEHPQAYVHRVMVSTFLRWNRRRWMGEIATERLPEHSAEDEQLAGVEMRDAVSAALDVLPPRQRAVVVLRYFADLSEAQTAAAMGCAVGTVKSQAAKALARLHGVPGLAEIMTEGLAT